MDQLEESLSTDPVAKRRSDSWAKWILLAIAAVSVLTLIVVGFYVGTVLSSLNSVKREGMLPEPVGRPPATAAAAGSLNYVLMGSDSRGEGDQGRSDVLMLAHVPPARDRVYIISFPRDLWVTVPGRGKAKINAAYAWGGPTLTTSTLESLVGVRMDHAARIDFEGFIGLTDQLGAVTVSNRVASKFGDYQWSTGPITIQGEEALAYVRQRKELPNGDLDRAERQRAVVKAMLVKLMNRDLLTDPSRFSAVMGEIGQYFTVDDRLTNSVIFSTATSMRISGAADILMLQAPITGFGRSPDGQSIDILNEPQFAELSTAIQTGRMAEYYAKYKDQPLGG